MFGIRNYYRAAGCVAGKRLRVVLLALPALVARAHRRRPRTPPGSPAPARATSIRAATGALGASFVVNGAAQARDAALTTASAEVKWRNGFAVGATFEGGFSNVTRSYAGRGFLRHVW
jgi:hypothetical protein